MYLEITVLWARIIEIKSLSRELTFLHFPPIEINFKNWAWISSNSRQLYLSMGRNYVHKKWRHQLALQLNVFVSHCVCLVKIYIYWLVMKPCDADRLPFQRSPLKLTQIGAFFLLSLIKTVWRFSFFQASPFAAAQICGNWKTSHFPCYPGLKGILYVF